jgi:hypothetical protein
MTWLADFLKRQGTPIHSDGSPYTRSQILGGELFDSCPVNVILSDGQWLPEQLAAINSNPQVAAAVSNCRYLPGGQAAPSLTTNNAPAAGSQAETLTRNATNATPGPGGAGIVYTPTGVATPTVITWPGGGSTIEPPQGPPAPIAAGFDFTSPLAIVAGLAILGFVFSGSSRKGRGRR